MKGKKLENMSDREKVNAMGIPVSMMLAILDDVDEEERVPAIWALLTSLCQLDATSTLQAIMCLMDELKEEVTNE